MCCKTAFGQNQSPFDLNFKKYDVCRWDWLKYKTATQIVLDHDMREKKTFLHLSYQRSVLPEMHFVLRKEIGLNKEVSGTATFELDVKGEYANCLSARVITLDNQNNRIREDEFDIKLSEKWKRKKIKINLDRAYSFQLVFSYNGTKDNRQSISLADTKIRINNEPLDTYIDKTKHLEYAEFIPVDLNHTILDNDLSFQQSEIIGLGECTHGSKTVSENVFNYVKSLVNTGSSKLILLEAPYSTVLISELFIQGKLKDNSFLGDYLDLGMNKEAKLPFLEWLKSYNDTTTTGRVHIFGIDNDILSPETLSDFYLGLLGEEKSIPYLKTLYSKNVKTELKNLAHTELKEALDSNETYDYFVDLLSPTSEIYEFNRFEDRDSLMYLRVNKLHKKYSRNGTKTLILAHSLHIQKSLHIYKEVYEKPLGYLLADKYGSKYFTIDFTFGTGKYLQDSCSERMSGFEKLDIVPAEGSFERLALNTDYDSFYLPTKFMQNPKKLLMIPRNSREGLYPIKNIRNSFDGVHFMKLSEAFTYYDISQWAYRDSHFRKRKEIHKKLIESY